MKRPIDRRQFLQETIYWGGLAGVSALVGPSIAWSGMLKGQGPRAQVEDPHFFLQLHVPGGADFSYLWDSRPLEFRAAGIRADYLGEEPKRYQTARGEAFVTSLFDPLRPYSDSFAIINGLHMSSDFDGHEQNTNLLFTGNPFGGEFFIPQLNIKKTPLDALSNGPIGATVTNDAKIAPLELKSLKPLLERIYSAPELIAGNPIFDALARRYDAVARLNSSGNLSQGSALLAQSLISQNGLRRDFARLKLDGSTDPLEQYLRTLLPLFQAGSTRALYLRMNDVTDADTHDSASAAKTPALLKTVIAALSTVFRVLKAMPYDGTRSYLDMTTVMFTTEFGRTLRQTGSKIDATGTDHNPYNNSCLIGGKGIVGGQVIGQSDRQTIQETLSGAHFRLDDKSLKFFGSPFDFKAGLVRTDRPQTYVKDDYISSASLINTVFKLFDSDSAHFRTNDRNGPIAKVIPGLLS